MTHFVDDAIFVSFLPITYLIGYGFMFLRRDSFLRAKSGCLLELLYLFFQVMRQVMMIADGL
jgi:hypothetical protein